VRPFLDDPGERAKRGEADDERHPEFRPDLAGHGAAPMA
jgi:hypothetical protein